MQIILLMGVAGSGKSTIGQAVASSLGWTYHEADDFHSPANKAKMSTGLPLSDSDREPWLAAIRAQIDRSLVDGKPAVFTCSALKEKYRAALGLDRPGILLAHLTGDFDTILARLNQRQGHYMKPEMLHSQFYILETPADALVLDIRQLPATLVDTLLQRVRSAGDHGATSR